MESGVWPAAPVGENLSYQAPTSVGAYTGFRDGTSQQRDSPVPVAGGRCRRTFALGSRGDNMTVARVLTELKLCAAPNRSGSGADIRWHRPWESLSPFYRRGLKPGSIVNSVAGLPQQVLSD